MDLSVLEDKVHSLMFVFDGLTADEIAQYLHLQGIKGYRINARECVISNYIHANIADAPVTLLTKPSAIGLLDKSNDLSFICLHSNSSNVKRFIVNFDDGKYCSLVAM